MSAPTEIVDVLGNRCPITRRYEDGSFDCPHCSYPVLVPAVECGNPWCLAHPDYPVERAREEVERRAADAREREARERNLRLARERIEEERVTRAAAWKEFKAEVERRGACRRCAARSFERGKAKMIRHRGPCPLAARNEA